MSAPGKAIFLSYASQDAEAARRICDALRAAGIEVWFDQSELRGGDAWDAAIRKQIKECALFLPIISANTQVRTEGYFRLEWRLAEQRTFLMAKGRPFLVPIVIDDTRDAGAHVPEAFLEVQWSRLPGGLCDAAFAAHAMQLLNWDGTAGPRHPKPSSSLSETTPPRRTRAMTYGALTAIVIGVAAATWVATHQKDGASSTAPVVPATPSASEADKLVQQARALVDDDPLAVRANFRTAQQLGERALELDPGHAGAYAIAARAGCVLIDSYNAGSPSTLSKVRGWAESAIRLAPDSIESGLALAAVDVMTNTRVTEVEQRLESMLQRTPDDRRVLRALQNIAISQRDYDKAERWIGRALSLPGSDAESLNNRVRSLWALNRYPEMATAIEQSLALKTTAAACHFKLMLLVWGLGDLEGGRTWVQQMPASLLQEDRVAYLTFLTWYWSRKPEDALDALRRFPQPIIEQAVLFRSTSYLRGSAHLLAGRLSAAKSEFTTGLQEINDRLAQETNNLPCLYEKVRLLARLGQHDEALQTRHLLEELLGARRRSSATDPELLLLTFSLEEAIADAGRSIDPTRSRWPIRVNELRFDPVFDPLRGDPRFQAIIERGESQLEQLRAGIASDSESAPSPAASPVGATAPWSAANDAIVAITVGDFVAHAALIRESPDRLDHHRVPPSR